MHHRIYEYCYIVVYIYHLHLRFSGQNLSTDSLGDLDPYTEWIEKDQQVKEGQKQRQS